MADDGPVITIFRSRLRPGAGPDYGELAARMLELAERQPGFVAFDHYASGEGERVSLITFDSLESQRAWRDHPEHLDAQRLGRRRFYETFSIQVCRLVEERRFAQEA